MNAPLIYLAREQEYRLLVSTFLSGRLGPNEFVLQYMSLWKHDRDLQWGAVNQGMTLDPKEQSLCSLLDDIFVVCDGYSEDPKSQFDISESRFRAEITSLERKLWPDEKKA